MKLGTENRKQLIALAVLVVIAIPVVYNFKHVLWGNDAAAAPAPAPTSVSPTKATGGLPRQDDSDPRLRTDILDTSRKVKYEAGGRNIFTMEEKIETPIANVRAQPRPEMGPVYWTPTPTPPPPPIPINYYGFANKPGEPRKVFLQQKPVNPDTPIFVAAQGDIVARRYRLVQIAANSVTMEDVLTGNRQDIKLTPR